MEVQAGDRWQLLPGIPDEITTDKIGPKLPWTTFHSLSRVNRGWRQAIQGHKFYDARVRSQSTRSVIALDVGHERLGNLSIVIALYSIHDNSSYLLPPIPGTGPQFGIQWIGGHCISLDSKVYILGGFCRSRVEDHPTNTSERKVKFHPTSSKVYVMDLAGQGQWKQCASMRDPRQWFGCGVMNGKIYVFGGLCNGWPVCGSEVYDPTKDVWSPIAPMLSFRCIQKVTKVGEELFVHSGCYIHSRDIFGSDDHLEWARNEAVDRHVSLGKGNRIRSADMHHALFAEVYRPLKDEWRIVENFTKIREPPRDGAEILMVEGKLLRTSPVDIDLYDNHSSSWIPWKSLSVDIRTTPYDLMRESAIVYNSILVEDYIIALAGGTIWTLENGETRYRSNDTLLRSDSLGGENKEIVLRELQIKSSLPPGCVISAGFPCTVWCAIQL